jgi:hypothetical protein
MTHLSVLNVKHMVIPAITVVIPLDASNVVTTISQRTVPKTGDFRLNALCVLVLVITQPHTKDAQFARNWYYQIKKKKKHKCQNFKGKKLILFIMATTPK